MKLHEVVRSTKGVNQKSRRKKSVEYYLPKGDLPVRVCKAFFHAKLDITDRKSRYLLGKVKSSTVPSRDMRGRHGNQAKTPIATVENVKQHILKFPIMESHYCRKGNLRKYLQPGLCLHKMYELYIEQCVTEKRLDLKVTEQIYRNVFNYSFNLSFFTPKKDQCDTCTAYKNKRNKNDEEEHAYVTHIRNKNRAREVKEVEKAAAKSAHDKKVVAACFDLQQVLNCPHGQVSVFFFISADSAFITSAFSIWKIKMQSVIYGMSVKLSVALVRLGLVFSNILMIMYLKVYKSSFFSQTTAGDKTSLETLHICTCMSFKNAHRSKESPTAF